MRNVASMTFPAPVRGWVKSGSQMGAAPDTAEVLDNFFPTAQGAEFRRGIVKHATVDDSVKRMFTYRSTADFFYAASDSAVYDVTAPADAAVVGTPVVSGLSSGDWSAVQMSTAGGEFVVVVNGTDYAMTFDGTEWNPIAGVAVNNLPYDGLSTDFAPGETVTGGTSGATAEVLAVMPSSATAGTLKVGTITGTFSDDEALTSAGGAATANIPSGTSAASAVTITNVATTALAQVWSFKERLFLVERNTQSAWYLPVESIGGAAVELDLGSVFRRGGVLLFGAAWSLDAGDGIDDVCVFVSSGGEIAVYEGTDPSSASSWALAGVYDIGEPLDKHAFFKAGGDLAILTEDGIVSVAEALRKDRAALQSAALTFPIEDEWRYAVQRRAGTYPINATLWQSGAMLVVGVPAAPGGIKQAFIANARTGAWGRFTGWDVRCGAVSGDQYYFGADDAIIYKGYTGGTDNGEQYTGTWIPKGQGGQDGRVKIANHAGITARVVNTFIIAAKAFPDYRSGEIAAPDPLEEIDAPTWGSATWGSFVWGGVSARTTRTRWKSVSTSGYALAPGFAVTSNQTSAPVFEIISAQIRYEYGSAF